MANLIKYYLCVTRIENTLPHAFRQEGRANIKNSPLGLNLGLNFLRQDEKFPQKIRRRFT